jgi:putative thioredoxin
MVVDVTPQTFEREVLQRSHEVPVVVDFWAEWCGPCRMLGPVLEQLAAEDEGQWVLAKIDTQAHPELAQRFGIQGIPAVKGIRDGQVVTEFVGARPAPAVRDWLRQLVPSRADELAKAARVALEGGDIDSAAAGWREALELQRDHVEALLSLAELVEDEAEIRELLRRLPPSLDPSAAGRRSAILLALETGGAPAEDLEATLTVNPDDLDARWQLAHLLVARGDHDAALGHLLEVLRRDRGYRDDGARKAMLEVFDVIGARSELADRWRKKLAMELYK